MIAGLAASAEEAAPPSFAWAQGPGTQKIGGSLAEIDLPEGYGFLAEEDTQRLLELMENPVSGQEMAVVSPASDQEDWFVVFEWSEIGWVDDEEKAELDSEAMLESIREGTARGNEERGRRGWSTIDIVGWQEEPHYDETTHNLTWAVAATSDGHRIVNRTVKLLGRRGVMTATLVADPDDLTQAAPASDRLLAAFRFQQGSTYAEYLPGTDKLAEVGLTALIVGGAGAALVKSGLLAKLWKPLAVGAVAVLAVFRRLIFGRKHVADPPTQV
jgi:uncharacterized membrane-anchored protein